MNLPSEERPLAVFLGQVGDDCVSESRSLVRAVGLARGDQVAVRQPDRDLVALLRGSRGGAWVSGCGSGAG